jgi:hypothetical protein
MDLLNSYVRMLRLILPKAERDDIVRELGEEIRSQAAEREAELGRPLNVDEQAALLKQYGHPLLTAARYRPQRYLIGPIVFPYFWLALKVVGGLVLAGHIVGGIVLFGRDPSLQQIGEAVEALVQNLFAITAWFTILGAVAERVLAKTRALETWDPRKLLPSRPQRAVQQRPGDPASLSGFVVGVVLSTWWLLALRYPFLMFGNGADNLDWGPAMNRLYPVLLAVQVTTLLEHGSRLWRPNDARLFRSTRVVWAISGVLFVYMILTGDHNWIVWRETADSRLRSQVIVDIAGRQFTMLDFINLCFSVPFTVAAVGTMLSLMRSAYRWLSGGGRPAAAAVALVAAVVVSPAHAQTPSDEQKGRSSSIESTLSLKASASSSGSSHGGPAYDWPRPARPE